MNNVVFHMFLCEYFFREKKVHKNFYFSFRFIFFLVFQFFADIGLLMHFFKMFPKYNYLHALLLFTQLFLKYVCTKIDSIA